MILRIEIQEGIDEEEITIVCHELNDRVRELQKKIGMLITKESQIVFYQGEREIYRPLGDVLFFETGISGIEAHTADDVYEVKYKLYELEEILPANFLRVSKSTILNVNRIFSITRNLTASSLVEFQNTHKQVYVSRYYYKSLKEKLKERKI